MRRHISHYFDRLSDSVTDWLGSTTSILMHTIIFAGFFALVLFGVSGEEVLLILTTVVSLEAIYLAIFIQRSVNKQSLRLDYAVSKIVNNVCDNLEEPLDEVVGEIRQSVKDMHDALIKTVVDESDQVVRELGEKVENETDELATSLIPQNIV
jgi:uncharacterized membrane protein